MSEKEKAYLDAVNNRCSISDNSPCVNCKAIHASCEYIHTLEAENTKLKEELSAERFRFREQKQINKDLKGQIAGLVQTIKEERQALKDNYR